jgi:hypothetical protein
MTPEKKTTLFTLIASFVVVLGLLAWAPWLTPTYAEYAVVTSVMSGQDTVADGCGFNCSGCGVRGSDRTVFGYLVTIEYACGVLPCDCYIYHRTSTVWVSCFGTVHGLPLGEPSSTGG